MDCGLSEAELEELLSYATNPFEHPDASISLPLEDEPSLTISSFVAMLESFPQGAENAP